MAFVAMASNMAARVLAVPASMVMCATCRSWRCASIEGSARFSYVYNFTDHLACELCLEAMLTVVLGNRWFNRDELYCQRGVRMMAMRSIGHCMGVENGSTGFRTTVTARLFEHFDYRGYAAFLSTVMTRGGTVWLA